jgi:DNA-binding beta-propeller fold protein YncE
MCNTYSQKLKGCIELMLAVTLTLAITGCTISSGSESVYVVNSYGPHHESDSGIQVHGKLQLRDELNSPSTRSTIDKLNGSDLAIEGTVTLGNNSHNVAATPDGSLLWATSRDSNNTSVVDADSLQIVKNIEEPSIVNPMGIAFTPDGSRAYIALESIRKVAIFDAKTYSYLSSIPVEGQPSFIVITPDGRKAYVVDYLSAKVVVLRTSDNSIVSTLDFRGQRLQDAVVSPDGSYVYVCNQDRNQIEVIRTRDDKVMLAIPIPMETKYPRGIGISPDGAYLFVGLDKGAEGKVDMIRLSDRSVVSSLPIHGTPRTIIVKLDGSRIFVSDFDNGKCYAIDVRGERLSSPTNVSLGSKSAPIGLAIVESQHEKQIASNTGPKTNNSSANSGESLPVSSSEKNNKSIPGFSALSMAFAFIMLFWLLKFR